MKTVEDIFSSAGVTLEHGVEGADNLKPEPKATSSGVDTKPWGSYKESDYTPAQWHAACLIHQHDGEPISKAQCKLPVKTPSGKLNKGGVQAAAAALAGSRGGVQASAEDKAKAASALRGHYKTIGQELPDSLKHSDVLDEVLEHHGIRGMKWGVRRGAKSSVTSRDAQKARTIKKKADSNTTKVKALSNKEIRQHIARMNLESQYNKLHEKPSHLAKLNNGHKFVKSALALGATANAVYAFSKTPAGKAVKEALTGSGKHFAKQ